MENKKQPNFVSEILFAASIICMCATFLTLITISMHPFLIIILVIILAASVTYLLVYNDYNDFKILKIIPTAVQVEIPEKLQKNPLLMFFILCATSCLLFIRFNAAYAKIEPKAIPQILITSSTIENCIEKLNAGFEEANFDKNKELQDGSSNMRRRLTFMSVKISELEQTNHKIYDRNKASKERVNTCNTDHASIMKRRKRYEKDTGKKLEWINIKKVTHKDIKAPDLTEDYEILKKWLLGAQGALNSKNCDDTCRFNNFDYNTLTFVKKIGEIENKKQAPVLELFTKQETERDEVQKQQRTAEDELDKLGY